MAWATSGTLFDFVGTGAFVSTFTWTVTAYLILVFLGAMFNLSERQGMVGIWQLPKSKYKRGALSAMLTTLLVFISRPDKPWIAFLVSVLTLCLVYGLSDYLNQHQRNIAAFLLLMSIGLMVIGLAAWHAW